MLESIIGRSVSPRQIAIVGVGVVITALVFGLSTWAVKPVQVPLFSRLADRVGLRHHGKTDRTQYPVQAR